MGLKEQEIPSPSFFTVQFCFLWEALVFIQSVVRVWFTKIVSLEALRQSREMWLFYDVFLAHSAKIQPQDHCQVVVPSSIKLPHAEIWYHDSISWNQNFSYFCLIMPRNPTCCSHNLQLYRFPQAQSGCLHQNTLVWWLKKNEGACAQLLSDRSQNHQVEARNLFIHHLVHY